MNNTSVFTVTTINCEVMSYVNIVYGCLTLLLNIFIICFQIYHKQQTAPPSLITSLFKPTESPKLPIPLQTIVPVEPNSLKFSALV